MSFSLSLRQSEFSNFHVEQAHKGHRYPIDFEIRSKDSSFTTRPHRRHCQSPTVASRNVPKRLLWIDREQVGASKLGNVVCFSIVFSSLDVLNRSQKESACAVLSATSLRFPVRTRHSRSILRRGSLRTVRHRPSRFHHT